MILQLKEEKRYERIIGWYQPNRCLPVLKARLGKTLPQFVYTLSPDKQTATLQIMNLYQLPQLKQFCDSVFSVINREHVPNLVIDVRNNKGGSSAGVDMLLSYLSHDAYTLYTKLI